MLCRFSITCWYTVGVLLIKWLYIRKLWYTYSQVVRALLIKSIKYFFLHVIGPNMLVMQPKLGNSLADGIPK